MPLEWLFCLSMMFKRRQQRSSKQPMSLEWLFLLFIEDQMRPTKQEQARKRKRKSKKRKEKERTKKKKKEKEKEKGKHKKRNKKRKRKRKKGKRKKHKGPKRQPLLNRSRAPAYTQKAKNKRKLRQTFCAQRIKKPYFIRFLRHKIAPHTRREKATLLEWRFVPVIGVLMSAKLSRQARTSKKKKKTKKKKKQENGWSQKAAKTATPSTLKHLATKPARK